MRLITTDDLIETYSKAVQRGIPFILSKLGASGQERTKSAFGLSAQQGSNWWSIPAVKDRWNTRISGGPDTSYETYTAETYTTPEQSYNLLSIGSGVCSHELIFATHPSFTSVHCVDLVEDLLDLAKANAKNLNLTNITFQAGDISKMEKETQFDFILFHSALHHFFDINRFIQTEVLPRLKPNGKVILHEYVGPNRLQYPRAQLRAINECLSLLPERYKTRHLTNQLKRSYAGPGLLRMWIADPSECADSAAIRPTMHKYFTTLEEKAIGGNLLMGALKDIAHHFISDTQESSDYLHQLFDLEDHYLMNHESDFIFGVYQNKA